VFLFDREGTNNNFENFLITNSENLFKLFDQLEADSNYFSKREGFKT